MFTGFVAIFIFPTVKDGIIKYTVIENKSNSCLECREEDGYGESHDERTGNGNADGNQPEQSVCTDQRSGFSNRPCRQAGIGSCFRI